MRKYSLKDPSGRAEVEAALRALEGWTEQPEQSCAYRLDFESAGQRVAVKQYTNGTLLMLPAASSEPLLGRLVSAVERVVPGIVPAGSPVKTRGGGRGPRGASVGVDVERPFDAPWIGSDEAGKGDYFGPLVAAAVYVDDRLRELLATLGVKDSKQLTDAQSRRLAQDVRAVCGDKCAAVEVPPERYNALYEQFRAEGKNLNSLLAWGHSRAIETVLERVPCENVIVDQFADARYIRGRLERKTRTLNVVQVPRAEANVAVAAASVLARDRFLWWLERASRDYGMTLPKGAAPQVEVAGRLYVSKFGREALRKVAKLHFKTTERVLRS